MLTSNLAGITKQESQSLSFLGTSIEVKGNTVSVSRPGYIANLISKYAVLSNASSPCTGSLFEHIPTGDTLPAYTLHPNFATQTTFVPTINLSALCLLHACRSLLLDWIRLRIAYCSTSVVQSTRSSSSSTRRRAALHIC